MTTEQRRRPGRTWAPGALRALRTLAVKPGPPVSVEKLALREPVGQPVLPVKAALRVPVEKPALRVLQALRVPEEQPELPVKAAQRVPVAQPERECFQLRLPWLLQS